jgi:S-adenosylmethionine synthetase
MVHPDQMADEVAEELYRHVCNAAANDVAAK